MDPRIAALYETQNGLPPGTLSAVLSQESGGNDYTPSGNPVTSPVGAMYAMQVMPATAANPGFGVTPAQNNSPQEYDRVGRDYLAALTQKYGGDTQKALAAYNWGPGNVDNKGIQNAPAETQNYVASIGSKIGNAIIPQANAATIDPSQVKWDQPSIDPTQVKWDAPQSSKEQQMVAQDKNEMNTGAISGPALQLGAYGLNALQAVPFSDEAISAVGAAGKTAMNYMNGGNQSFGDNYSDLQQRQQAMREAGQQTQPVIQTPRYLPNITPTGIGQVGATALMAPLLPEVGASKTLPLAIGKGTAIGAGYGGLYGAGEGNAFQSGSDSANTRMGNAVTGALTGAVLGSVTPLIGAGLNKIGQATGLVAQDAPLLTPSDVRTNATAAYQDAEAKGGVLSPTFTDNFLQTASDAVTEPESVTRAFGNTPVQRVVQGLSDEYSGKPITLDEASAIDKRFGLEIENQVNDKTGKLNSIGQQLYDIQTKFRDMIDNAGPQDIIGGRDGFDALANARQLWSQQARASDIQRIISRGESMDNPATSIRSGFRTLMNNPVRMRGYSPEQQALIQQAAKASLPAEGLRALGSRLISIGGLASGHPLAAAANLGMSAASRSLAGSMQAARGQRVINNIVGNVPKTQPVNARLIAIQTALADRKRGH